MAVVGIGDAEAGLAFVRLVWRPMRPVLEFGRPSQAPGDAGVSWWHIPVSISDAGILHKQHLPLAEVVAVRYLGDELVGEGINLRWETRDGHEYRETLEYGRTYKVPFARRDEGDGVITICNDDVFQNHLKWRLTRDGFFRWDERIHTPEEVRNIEWRIEVRRPAKRPWVSRSSYLISVPTNEAPNDEFQISMR